jgi:hypothetical protein
LAAAADPLRCQQALPAQQAEHPFPADMDGVLAAQPGADLAVALASERRGDQHLVDQPEQVGVADRGSWARPPTTGCAQAAGIDRGARRTEHAADHGHRQLALHG